MEVIVLEPANEESVGKFRKRVPEVPLLHPEFRYESAINTNIRERFRRERRRLGIPEPKR